MGLVIDFHQFPHADVSVSLRRREADMTEHLLNLPEVRPCIEKMGGKGMAKAMGTDFSKDA